MTSVALNDIFSFVYDTRKYNEMHQNKTNHDLEIHVSYMSLYTSDPTK